jgi:hypothetical protein
VDIGCAGFVYTIPEANSTGLERFQRDCGATKARAGLGCAI